MSRVSLPRFADVEISRQHQQIVILKLPERRASAASEMRRRTLKDLQWQRLWQVQRVLRSFAVLRAFRSLRSLSATAGF